MELVATGAPHAGCGQRENQHGNRYHVELLLLVTARALQRGGAFDLGAEVRDYLPFDDIVFRRRSPRRRASLLQLKHTRNAHSTIWKNGLIDSSNGDFSIPKYYKAYCGIMNNQKLNTDTDYMDFTLCTNSQMDPTLFSPDPSSGDRNQFVEIEVEDDLLKFDAAPGEPAPRRLLIKPGSDFFNEVVNKLRDPENTERVETFLRKLIFAVNLPGYERLRAILDAEIESLDLDDGGLVAGHLRSCISHWTQQKDGVFATREDLERLMTDIARQLTATRLAGAARERRAELLQLGCAFKPEALVEIASFLASEERVLLLVYSHQLLTDIKLMQLLPETHTAQARARRLCLFTKVAEFATIKGTKICPVEAFRSKANTLLVAALAYHDNDFDKNYTEVDNAKRLISEITDDLKDTTKNKVILIIPSAFQTVFDNTLNTIKTKKVIDERNGFDDLTDESQELLKQAKVRIRGCGVTISALKESSEVRRWLSGSELEQLIEDRLVPVPLPAGAKHHHHQRYEDMRHYFLERSVQHHVILSEYILRDDKFLVWNSAMNDERQLEPNQEIILVSDNADEFQDLCNNAKYEKVNIHWLKDGCLWQKSRGSPSSLLGHKKNEASGAETAGVTQRVSELSDRIVIIAAEPGMGKSTVLMQLALAAEQAPGGGGSRYTAIASLRDYSTYFSRMPDVIGHRDAIQFLFCIFMNIETDSDDKLRQFNLISINTDGSLTLEPGDSTTDWIRAKLFAYLYNEHKIVALFDGFDEIAGLYKDKLLSLFDELKRSRLHAMWVTTRPYHILAELERPLGMFSYQLVPFDDAERAAVLAKFWEHDNEPNIETVISEFLERFIPKILWNDRTFSDQSGFMGIPLHITMIAEVYKATFRQFYNDRHCDTRETQTLTIYDLYTRFVEGKFKIFWEKEKHDQQYKGVYESTVNELQKLGLMELFSREEVPRGLLSDEEWRGAARGLGDVRSLRRLLGLVTGRGFLHRTFAEYFAAGRLADTLRQERDESRENQVAKGFLYHILTSKPLEIPRLVTFLNYNIVSSSEHRGIFNAAIAFESDKFDLFNIHRYSMYLDAFGRTPLHLLCSGSVYFGQLTARGKARSKNLFLNSLLTKDSLFKWTPIHYAVACHDCDSLARSCSINFDSCLKYKFEELHESPGRDNDAKDTLPNNTDEFDTFWGINIINLEDENGQTPYLLAARRGCYGLFCYKILETLPLNVNVQDNEGKTALHLALAHAINPPFVYDDLDCAYYLIKLPSVDLLLADNNGIRPLDMIASSIKPDGRNGFNFIIALVCNIYKRKNDRMVIESFLEKLCEPKEWACLLLSFIGESPRRDLFPETGEYSLAELRRTHKLRHRKCNCYNIRRMQSYKRLFYLNSSQVKGRR